MKHHLHCFEATLFSVLFFFRYMLRAAHTKSILGKSRRSAANSSRTRTVKEENDVIGGYSARSAGTKRSASSSSRGNVSKYCRNGHGGRSHATSAQSAKETAEVTTLLTLILFFA